MVKKNKNSKIIAQPKIKQKPISSAITTSITATKAFTTKSIVKNTSSKKPIKIITKRQISKLKEKRTDNILRITMQKYFQNNLEAFRKLNPRGNTVTAKDANGKTYTLYYKTTTRKMKVLILTKKDINNSLTETFLYGFVANLENFNKVVTYLKTKLPNKQTKNYHESVVKVL